MKDDTRMRAMMVTALVLALAAMLAGPASARPIDLDGRELTASERATLRPDDKAGPLGVGAIATQARQSLYGYAMDYRSHKTGPLGGAIVTQANPSLYGYAMDYRPHKTGPLGGAIATQANPSLYGYAMDYRPQEQSKPVIPYLSHGQGVDASQFSGTENAQSNSGRSTGLQYADQPASATQASPQSDDRTGWIEPTGFGVAIAGVLLAGMALLATRRRHGNKVAV
jgi:hypothetical protein